MKLTIETDGLINIKTGTVSPPSRIIINEGIIEKIESLKNMEDTPTDSEETFNARGKFVIPGLIDSHVHLNLTAGHDPLKDLLGSNNEELYETSLKNAQLALNYGVTTLRDCGSMNDTVMRLKNDILSGKVSGPNILTSGRVITTRNGHLHFAAIEADTPEEIISAAEELLKEGVNFYKLIISGGNMTPGSNPLLDQYGIEEISTLVDFANAHDKKVSAHIHTKNGMIMALDAGIHIIEHGSWRTESGIDIDEDILGMLAQNGTAYCTALPNIYTRDPENLLSDSEEIEKFRKIQKDRITATVKNIQSGMVTVLGTDAGTKENMIDELVNHAVLIQKEAGLSNVEVLKMMTLNPCEVFYLKSRGTIEKGKVADMVVLNENPLENISNLNEISAVIKSGEIKALRF